MKFKRDYVAKLSLLFHSKSQELIDISSYCHFSMKKFTMLLFISEFRGGFVDTIYQKNLWNNYHIRPLVHYSRVAPENRGEHEMKKI